MIKTKENLHEYMRCDAEANGVGSYFLYLIKLIYGNEASHAVRYLRALRCYEYSMNSNSLWGKLMLPWRRFRWSRLGLRYGIRIMPNVVDKGLKINHIVGGIIINCEYMGKYCSVTGGCVIGNVGSNERRPSIGNRCEFTLGTKVLGKITIGDNAVIAPNSVVVKDVSANSVVSGIPAIEIKKNK